MNLYPRALSCLALLGMSLATLSQFRPAWAAEMSLDWWNLSELREEVRRGEEQHAALTGAGSGLAARLAAKDEAVRALLAGRLTLTEAAARFRDLSAAAGPTARPLCDHYTGATEEERLCRQVIAWAVAAAEIPGSPESGEPTRERLEADLDALLRTRHGVIALPR